MLKSSKKILKSFFLLLAVSMKPSSSYFSLNDKLVDKLISDKTIKSSSVEAVMRAIDRGQFTGGNYAYYDSPTGIGYSATISAPHMHAWALVNLKL